MTSYNAHQQTASTLNDIDYNFYIQRGRQEQARAVRATFADFAQWLRTLKVKLDRYGQRLLNAAEQPTESKLSSIS